MAKKQRRHEHLGGDADHAIPGWQARITERVMNAQRERQARRGAGAKNWPERVQIQMDLPMRHLLRRAADSRGMSITGYVRRAMCAFVAADLGMAFADVAKHTPYPVPPAGPLSIPVEQRRPMDGGAWADDGLGYGTWEVRS